MMNFITQDYGSDDDSQKCVVSNLPFTPSASHPNSTPISTANCDLSSYAIRSAANLKDDEDNDEEGEAVANMKDDGIAGSLQGRETQHQERPGGAVTLVLQHLLAFIACLH